MASCLSRFAVALTAREELGQLGFEGCAVTARGVQTVDENYRVRLAAGVVGQRRFSTHEAGALPTLDQLAAHRLVTVQITSGAALLARTAEPAESR